MSRTGIGWDRVPGGRLGLPRLSLLLALVIFACTPEVEPESPGDEVFFARSVIPFDPTWRPLGEVPVEPQENPEMVIWEVSAFAEGAEASPAQVAAAADLVERCYQAAERNGWLDFDKALADGFIGLFQDRRHYANWEFVNDVEVLNPERPEFLMYYATPEGMRLIGFMFYTSELAAHGAQIGGPLTLWHYHVWKTATCLRGGLLPIGQALESGRCLTGDRSHRSPEMLHVWLVDRPEGPFFTEMYIEPKRIAGMLAKRQEERGEPW